MSTVKIKATKLANASVQWVSLVERGASRIPFRVIKADKEKDMINLNTFFARKSDAPVLAAIVVAKNESLPKVTEAIKAAGFVVDKAVEDDANGNVIFKQADGELDAKTHGMIQMSPDMGIVVKGFDPNTVVKGTALEEAVKTAGFLPSIAQVSEAHAALLQETLTTNGNVGVVAEKNSKEFNKFVADTARVIPAAAFKLEKAISEIMKEEPDESEEEKKLRLAAAEKKRLEEEAAKAEATKKAAEEKTALENAAKTSEAVGTVVKAMESLAGVVKAMSDQVTALADTTKVIASDTKTLATAQKELTARVTEAETIAKAAKAAVKGTIVTGAGPGDHLNSDGTPKGRMKLADGRDAITDTAFMKRERVGKVYKFSA